MEQQTTPPPALTWSASFLGIEHLGGLHDPRSASVCEWHGYADCCFWTRGVSFAQSPLLTFDSLERAKAAAEAWVAGRPLPQPREGYQRDAEFARIVRGAL